MNYTEEYKKEVAAAANEPGATFKSVGVNWPPFDRTLRRIVFGF